MAEWMIDNGSDVHQGGDGPLMRAALFGHRMPMMELLVSRGANVNAVWNGYFPIIFAPCETVEPLALEWLLQRGANPNCADPQRKYPGTALDYVIGTYARSQKLSTCIDILLSAGTVTKYNIPAVLNLLRNRLDLLAENLDGEPALLHRRFAELDFGSTAARRLKLGGATLLHMAAEYGNAGAAKLLLDRGADVNAHAAHDPSGIGGQTAIFHAVSQFGDWGLAVAELLLDRGADVTVRAKLPGHYERLDEYLECTPMGYALRFPGADEHSGGHFALKESRTVALLRARGAVE